MPLPRSRRSQRPRWLPSPPGRVTKARPVTVVAAATVAPVPPRARDESSPGHSGRGGHGGPCPPGRVTKARRVTAVTAGAVITAVTARGMRVPTITAVTVTSECLSGLDVQGRSFPQQIRPLPERAKIKLMTLLPRCPVMHKLLHPLDFEWVMKALTRASPEARASSRSCCVRSSECEMVLRRYCVPPLLLVHELLLESS
jgi:hypothetical protein